jgi:ParB family chromosome partitioning protein
MVEVVILLAASHGNSAQVLRDAATAYKVDTDAIATEVKQEFAGKEKAKAVKKSTPKAHTKATKKAVA